MVNFLGGTNEFMAPELWLTKHEYDGFKADVFACGVILFQMYVGERLFNKAKSSDEVYNLIMEKNYDKFWVKVNKKKANIPTDLKSLIQGMLCLDNKQRLSIDEVISNKWLNHKPILEKDIMKYMNFKKTAGVQAQKKAKASIDIKDKLAPLENFN